MIKVYLFALVSILLFPINSFSQNMNSKQIDSLLKHNNELIVSNPKKALTVSSNLYNASQKISYKNGLLVSLLQKTLCYTELNNFKEAIEYADKTILLAKDLENPYIHTQSLKIKASQYRKVGLYDEALDNTEEALKISNSITSNDERHNLRGMIFTTKSIILSQKMPTTETIKWQIKAMKEFEQVKGIPTNRYYNYNNVGYYYFELKKYDSSHYYYNKALRLKIKPNKDNLKTKSNIYVNIANLYYFEKKLDSALVYNSKSLVINKKLRDYYMLCENYKLFTDIYRTTNNKELLLENQNLYIVYKDSFDLHKENSIDSSVGYIVNNIKKEKKETENNLFLVILFSVLGFTFTVFIIRYFYKNYSKELEEKKEKEEIIIEKQTELNKMALKVTTSYEDVIELAKKDDPLFSNLFKELYPEFYENLVTIQPDLSLAEQRFCFYLRLNFTTKEIAEYTFVTPKAVQNRKNRLRKRLGIPENEDIYSWIEKLG